MPWRRESARRAAGAGLAAFALAALAPPPAAAQGGPFGLGIIIGEPSGLSAKLFLADAHAVHAALDFSFVDDAIYVHADYILHFAQLGSRIPRGRRHIWLPYVGIGGKIAVHERDDDDDDGRLGLRVPLGIAWLPRPVPIDVFVEIVPGLEIVPETDPDLEGGLGVRYFF